MCQCFSIFLAFQHFCILAFLHFSILVFQHSLFPIPFSLFPFPYSLCLNKEFELWGGWGAGVPQVFQCLALSPLDFRLCWGLTIIWHLSLCQSEFRLTIPILSISATYFLIKALLFRSKIISFYCNIFTPPEGPGLPSGENL